MGFGSVETDTTKESDRMKKLMLPVSLALVLAIAGPCGWAQMGPTGGGQGGGQMSRGPMSPDQKLPM